MMRTAFACAAATAVLLTAGVASAQDTPEITWNLGVTSDYVFRGYSQTSEDPAIFGGVDLTVGAFYAGAWASNVDFGDSTDGEIDIYGGYRTEAAGFAFDLGVVGYLYPSAPDGADYDYVELKAAASRAFGPVALGAVVFWSPDFFGADEEATYVEANAAFSPAPKWTLSGAIGHQTLDVNADYATWNAGVAYAFTDQAVVDVRYHDTDVSGPLSDDRLVGTIKLLF
ncbi:MAG: TorF family putative porin [Alphaproteobacteria bacterium]|nr:TorF family putative porin [Alphaproteobacteria bacterium]MBU1525181.1 TorF family putative porin [Alphaproteobacteria bacterium]MBU2352177.1 TorF family putative porin [Alphaproteobacteria bacterium]MBU2381187.1 TorF family putative porin [Alphaproteobacteria bacterium]